MTNWDSDIVIHPRKGKSEKAIPETGLLLVNPSEAVPRIDAEIKRGAEKRTLFNSKLSVSPTGSYFLAGPAIGAPMASMTLEKLIVLGAKRVILCGWCGAVDQSIAVGDIVIPDSAHIGEGTSQYYGETLTSRPSESLSTSLIEAVAEPGVKISRGCVWSTDGVYRESRNKLKELNEQQSIVAVDMEFSALCSVAAFRNIDFAALLIVSDEVCSESWKPGFSKNVFKVNKESAYQRLVARIERLKEV